MAIDTIETAAGSIAPRRPGPCAARTWRSSRAASRPWSAADRSVDVFVRRLRFKLVVAAPGWRYIHTHFGVGYRFAPERFDRG
jgi:DNA-binding response OmpR family regulator